MTRYYCSVFSRDYAYKGLALYHSLLRWDRDFHFFLVCLHDEAGELFERMGLQHATILPLSAVEEKDPTLEAVKKSRSDKEYIWTSKASVMLHILGNYPHVDRIVWLDGDTFFYSCPEPIFREWGRYSILLTEERWGKGNARKILQYGKYNTGFMGFARDEQAFESLNWFRGKLIRWCYDRHEGNLWSDQLYVNDWPKRFKNVGVVRHPGVNVTPYFIRGCKVTKEDGHVHANGEKLILYHPYGFRYYDGGAFDLCSYVMSFADDVLKWVYLPYIQALRGIMGRIQEVDRDFYREAGPKNHRIRNYFNLEANREAGEERLHICTLLTGDYVLQGLALYNSLLRHTPRFHLWVLCVDDTAYDLLEGLELSHVTLLSLKNLRNKRLARIQRQRQAHEFCWTLKPWLLSYLLKNNYGMKSVLYVDADVFFFRDAGEVFAEWGEHSLFLTRLGLSAGWEKKVGKYSAGLIGFRRDDTGSRCLETWRRKCLKWCFDRREKGLWGDQKYLDEWPGSFSSLKVSGNIGINAGPWNIKGARVHMEGGRIRVDGRELVCYHFSGFIITAENDFTHCTRKRLPGKVKPIYSAYEVEVRCAAARIKSVDKDFFEK